MREGNTFDIIVIGSGISGGWAAKEFAQNNFKTLVVERGKRLNRQTENNNFSSNNINLERNKDQLKTDSGGLLSSSHKYENVIVDETEYPYEKVKPANWVRVYMEGGRSMAWSRSVYRWSDLDFNSNMLEGVGVDWPIRYKDLSPWYDYVEKYIGVSGENLGLDHFPDSQLLPPMPMNEVERHLRNHIESNYENRYLTIGRCTNLSEDHNGRAKCKGRMQCEKGCPSNSYFSSSPVTLSAAIQTGNTSIKHNEIVESIIFDEQENRAIGVNIVNAVTLKKQQYFAKVIFCTASTIATTQILLNSISERFPNGLGNDSGQLGKNLMDHHYMVGAYGIHSGFKECSFENNRPVGIYIPRFRNLGKGEDVDFIRGFQYQGAAIKRINGSWFMELNGFGESLPYEENRVTLNHNMVDKWGIPIVQINAEFKKNEIDMRKDMMNSAAEMLASAGFRGVTTFNKEPIIGECIHEMGTARMGMDPKCSVLNKFNQMHAVNNVFVTDGACMTSSSNVNPSLTYMALTARASHYAIQLLKEKRI